MLLLLLTVGCQQDLVRVMGTVTGVRVVPHPPPSAVVEEAPRETPSPVATVSTPTSPPQVVAPAQPVASAKTSGKSPSSSFNPISMPEGPRDSPGVRWQGVRGNKTQDDVARDRDYKKRDP